MIQTDPLPTGSMLQEGQLERAIIKSSGVLPERPAARCGVWTPRDSSLGTSRDGLVQHLESAKGPRGRTCTGPMSKLGIQRDLWSLPEITPETDFVVQGFDPEVQTRPV
jgi:hypothetical protein